jgi:hypothetical protein
LVVYGVTDKFLKYIESWGFKYTYNWYNEVLTVNNIPVRYCQEFNAPAGCYLEVDI